MGKRNERREIVRGINGQIEREGEGERGHRKGKRGMGCYNGNLAVVWQLKDVSGTMHPQGGTRGEYLTHLNPP